VEGDEVPVVAEVLTVADLIRMVENPLGRKRCDDVVVGDVVGRRLDDSSAHGDVVDDGGGENEIVVVVVVVVVANDD
jgi:uncharacterized protein YijF (DUF1287 family)